jgi:hypothetical protein
MRDFLEVGCRNGQKFAILQLARLRRPTLVTVHRLGPSWNYPLYGNKRAPAADDSDLQAAVVAARSPPPEQPESA